MYVFVFYIAMPDEKKRMTEDNSVIVSFRIFKNRSTELDAIKRRDRPLMVRSAAQMAKKVVLDFLSNRLQYTEEKFRHTEPES